MDKIFIKTEAIAKAKWESAQCLKELSKCKDPGTVAEGIHHIPLSFTENVRIIETSGSYALAVDLPEFHSTHLVMMGLTYPELVCYLANAFFWEDKRLYMEPNKVGESYRNMDELIEAIY